VGLGASAYCLGRQAGAFEARLAGKILGSVGLALKVRESAMDAVTAVSGSGPAYVFLFMEALQAAGVKAGLAPQTCFKLAAQTISGAARMIQCSQESPASLRQKVTSPGGTTERALQALEKGGFRSLVEKAVLAAQSRSREMGKVS
jgi:pyrroline-5-carboxylate reductase